MLKKRTILVVDDNIVNREVLCKILSREYVTLEAENGQEALDILEQKAESISAILLDLIMPVMNGHEFMEIQQKDSRFSVIPVIVTTQKDGEQSELETLSYGASDFLAKPYNPTIMLRRLANTIRLRETAAFVNIIERDSLTGLYNKEAFYTKAASLMAENPDKKFDMICIDVESFKTINDMYGEVVGDALLCYVAMEINKNLSNVEGYPCRASGDIFFIIMERQEGYDKVLTEQAKELQNDYPINMRVTVKYGIYQIEDTSLTIRAMCDRAKLAVQTIKGKYESFCALYDDSLRNRILEEQMISREMEAALEEGQFKVYFQPKVNLNSGEIIGAEALVRWDHPERGVLTPDRFISVFEGNGFITDLDSFVRETVCRQIREWMDKGYKSVPVSVNVSRVDIYNPKLLKNLKQLIERYQLEPNQLPLEITEISYTENAREMIEVVSSLKDKGFSIVMDDFGKGYSSLSMLSDVPMDVLKLDMGFLNGGTEKKNSKKIINFLINFAKELGMTVVVERVEKEEQVNFLKSIHCRYGQGFYFYKPMPKEEFEKLLSWA